MNTYFILPLVDAQPDNGELARSALGLVGQLANGLPLDGIPPRRRCKWRWYQCHLVPCTSNCPEQPTVFWILKETLWVRKKVCVFMKIIQPMISPLLGPSGLLAPWRRFRCRFRKRTDTDPQDWCPTPGWWSGLSPLQHKPRPQGREQLRAAKDRENHRLVKVVHW